MKPADATPNATAAGGNAARPARARWGGLAGPTDVRRLALPTVLLVLLTIVGMTAPGTWRFVAIAAVVQALLALSAGMLFGRVGLLSLCQVTFAGIAAWVVCWLNVNQPLPFLLTIAIGALAAVPAGLLVGGLAVRLRGVNLAIVTMAFAAAVVAWFTRQPFPGSQDSVLRATRPTGFTSDRMYFLLCIVVLVAIGLGLERYGRHRGGQAWRAVRSSERATAAAGLSVPAVKLRAFVVSAAIAGVAGGLFTGQLKGSLGSSSFLPLASLAVVAAAVMLGAQSLSGAVLAGLLAAVLPEAFRRFGWSTEYPQILFGVGAVHALSQGGGGISATFPWRRPRHSTARPPAAPAPLREVSRPERGAAPVLEVRGLEVRYGALAALSEVDLVVPPLAIVGLIGPNGAGKSTLVDAVCGFVRGYRGQVLLGGEPVDGLSATARAKAGLRRTFQQGRAIPELTVGQYVNVHVARPLPPDELDDLLGFFGLPPADEPIEFIDVGTRRVLEVAACVAAKPRVALLDEPAAGLGESQSAVLAERIREMPDRFGCSVVLIDTTSSSWPGSPPRSLSSTSGSCWPPVPPPRSSPTATWPPPTSGPTWTSPPPCTAAAVPRPPLGAPPKGPTGPPNWTCP
ncbi:MAG: ATP-binding cassette domain-containing protein [Acidimicrobiia bacterium]|nr:ATP-binding cassette domain-containing protein [Acidimicrobiia bacterium]